MSKHSLRTGNAIFLNRRLIKIIDTMEISIKDKNILIREIYLIQNELKGREKRTIFYQCFDKIYIYLVYLFYRW